LTIRKPHFTIFEKQTRTGDKVMKKFAVVLVAISLMFPAMVRADNSCRCQGNLIEIGDHKSKVQAYCGKPDYKENTGEKVYKYDEEKKTLYIQEWAYKKYQANLIITFEGSKVVDIQTESFN